MSDLFVCSDVVFLHMAFCGSICFSFSSVLPKFGEFVSTIGVCDFGPPAATITRNNRMTEMVVTSFPSQRLPPMPTIDFSPWRTCR